VEDLERKASEEEFLAHFGIRKVDGIYRPPLTREVAQTWPLLRRLRRVWLRGR
jgi:hypothetical protein